MFSKFSRIYNVVSNLNRIFLLAWVYVAVNWKATMQSLHFSKAIETFSPHYYCDVQDIRYLHDVIQVIVSLIKAYFSKLLIQITLNEFCAKFSANPKLSHVLGCSLRTRSHRQRWRQRQRASYNPLNRNHNSCNCSHAERQFHYVPSKPHTLHFDVLILCQWVATRDESNRDLTHDDDN